MKAARLTTTNQGTGQKTPTQEVVLVCSLEEARIMFEALDLYCTQNATNSVAAAMYHTFGWGGELLPTNPAVRRSAR